MPFERWGSLSTADHTDTAALVANVLLYDRLVIPVMAKADDRDEEYYWVTHGWDPKLQSKRVDQLGDLAVGRPWNAMRRELYKTRIAELQAERRDAPRCIDPYQTSREILADEEVAEKFPGVEHVDVIAAYNSTESAFKDFQVDVAGDGAAAQAVLLTRCLAIPDLPNVEDSLQVAIDLSHDQQFRQKRADLFEWQERMIEKGIKPDAVVAELSGMTNAYNAAVKSAQKKVLWRYVFTVSGIAVGFATGGPLGAGASAVLSLLHFSYFDATPAVEAGRAKPAAMFHDISTKIGASLKTPAKD
jgi:hypothetical protein